MGSLEISWNDLHERDAILAFIVAMGFTPRDAITWDELAMRAIVARRGERIVGVLPIEPRTVCVGDGRGDGRTARAAHQTCVALLPDERGNGLGSQMQMRLDELLPSDVELITVFREDPASRAYAWYRQNRFEPRLRIASWEDRQQLPSEDIDAPPTVPANVSWLAAAWRSAGRQNGFFVDQRERPLAQWLATHPYRSRYAFEIVPLAQRAYAVVGIGQLHSDRPRLDVLDLVASDERDAAALLQTCRVLAATRGAPTVRIALAEQDPFTRLQMGARTWQFDLLVKSRGPIANASPDGWRYASIDFA